ncbi:sensor histidine kinase [Celeribacter sp.]|uniref:sensor histidine kinase n=1 Tax=Celeribacter sp. TaxID=1890673 RepID=UPI003A924AF3
MIALAAMGVQRLSYGYFKSEELAKAEGRLSLYRTSVSAELERFSHLTHVLARDSYVIATATGGDTVTLNLRLEDFADRAGLDAIYLMDGDGLTIAASNHAAPTSFLGQNYAFRPYFQDAREGRQGRFYAIGATTGLPGYFIADAVRDRGGNVQGVIAIKIAFADLEDSWRRSGEQVILANGDGVVLLASDPAWRYRVLRPLDAEQRAAIVAARQFSKQPLAPLDWVDRGGSKATIGGEERLHLTTAVAPHDWELHYFTADDRAVALSWLVTAAIALLAGIALFVFQYQRTQRIGRALRRSEEEEAQLRQANERLEREIEVRRTAERRLQRTQSELERASRLAALGQLSASVTHELGQPIAAMRNHLAAAEIGAGSTSPLTEKIGDLVERMEGITRQLKFFARSDRDPFDAVDLRDALHAAAALVEPNLTAAGATLHVEAPDDPVFVHGSRLRIEQVFTNLLRNAVDAVEDVDVPTVRVTMGTDDGDVWIEISDNGHGLGAATLADLQEPFVTTRESGRGMGLGLAISASIIKDHEGTMSARNAESGGAVFRVTFPARDGEEDGQ